MIRFPEAYFENLPPPAGVSPALYDMRAISQLRVLRSMYLRSDKSILIEAFSVKNPHAESYFSEFLEELRDLLPDFAASLFLERTRRKRSSPTQTLAYAMRFNGGFDGPFVTSKGVALAAGKEEDLIHVLTTSKGRNKQFWKEIAQVNKGEGEEILAYVLGVAQRNAVMVSDDRWIYNERLGLVRRVAREGVDAGLFTPSGIILNNPGVATRIP